VPFFLIMTSVVFLIVLQPDFGSVLIMGPLCVILYFVGGGSVRYIAIMAAVFAVLAGSVYALGRHEDANDRNSFSYITDRIDNFLADSKTSIANKTINFQTEQGLIAIGSGGFSGVGFGKSLQKFGYLPETQGDFIFSVIAEELGFVGVMFLISIYLAIVWRGFRIARMVEDLFAKYAAVGITSWIAIQAFVNIGVNLNIIPLTGVTLPFVSYGGSSLLSLLIAVAILLGISRQARPTQAPVHSYARGERRYAPLTHE
jgi:cell division protein FtsW